MSRHGHAEDEWCELCLEYVSDRMVRLALQDLNRRITELEEQAMTESAEQAHLNADVSAIRTEIDSLKAQNEANGTPLDFSALDALLPAASVNTDPSAAQPLAGNAPNADASATVAGDQPAGTPTEAPPTALSEPVATLTGDTSGSDLASAVTPGTPATPTEAAPSTDASTPAPSPTATGSAPSTDGTTEGSTSTSS